MMLLIGRRKHMSFASLRTLRVFPVRFYTATLRYLVLPKLRNSCYLMLPCQWIVVVSLLLLGLGLTSVSAGTPPTQAFGAIREELVEKIRREREEKRKKEEEEKRKLLEKMAQHKDVLEQSKPKPDESPEPERDKKEDEYVVLSIEELGALLEVADEEEPGAQTKEGEPEEEEGDKAEEGSVESETVPEEGEAGPE